MRICQRPIFIASAILLSGCGSTSNYLSSQQTVIYPDEGTITLVDPELATLFEPKCMKPVPPSPLSGPHTKEQPQCLYIAVGAAKATSAASPSRATRDKAIAYLLGISDSNCLNFLDRAFASKASMEVTKNLTQDIATGVGAITAFNSPAATAALGLSNLVIGKTVDNVSTTFFFDRTFQAFEAAVLTERARLKTEIIAKQAQRPPVSTEQVVQYTLIDALADIRNYDAACSMRVGLAKLLETQGEKKRVQFEQSSQADIQARATSLEVSMQNNPTGLKPDGPSLGASAPTSTTRER